MAKCPPWCDPLKRAIAYVSTQTLLMLKKELVYGLGQGPKLTDCKSDVFVIGTFLFLSLFRIYPCRDASRVLRIFD